MVLGALGTVGAVTRAMAVAPAGEQTSPGDQLTYPSPDLTPYVDDLWIPPSLSGDRTLSMARSSHRFHRDLGTAPTWSFGGQPYLGPTIEARSGEKLKLTFTNNLDGQVFVFFIITVAAAEVSVGLALIVALYRKRQTAHVEDLTLMKN